MNKALYLTSINLIAAISSFFSGILLAKYFGGSGELSGYFAGFNFVIPLNMLLLKAQGKAFIPFISTKTEKQNEITSVLLKFNLLLLVSIAVVIFLSSGLLPNLISPGLPSEYKVYVTKTLQILAVYIISANCFGFFQGIFHFNNVFIKPAILNLLPSVSLLIVLLTTNAKNVLILPVTHTAAITTATILAFFLCKHLFLKSRTKITEYKSEIAEYSGLAMPIILYSIFMWAIKFIDTLMASYIKEESISHLEYARKLVSQPELITGVFATIYFPLLAKLNANKKEHEFNKVFIEGAEKTFFVSATIGLLIFLNSTEIIRVIYQRGEFSIEDTQVVSDVLKGFIGVIVIASLGTYFSNMYYSKKRTKLVAVLSVISSLTNIVLNFIFVYVFKWQVAGIAVASSIAYLVGISLQIIFLKKISLDFSYSQLFRSYAKIIGVILCTYIFVQYGQSLIFKSTIYSENTTLSLIINLLLKSSLQFVIILILAMLLDIARIRSKLFQVLRISR